MVTLSWLREVTHPPGQPYLQLVTGCYTLRDFCAQKCHTVGKCDRVRKRGQPFKNVFPVGTISVKKLIAPAIGKVYGGSTAYIIQVFQAVHERLQGMRGAVGLPMPRRYAPISPCHSRTLSGVLRQPSVMLTSLKNSHECTLGCEAQRATA